MQAVLMLMAALLVWVAADFRRYSDSRIKPFTTEFVLQFIMIISGLFMAFAAGKYL